MVDDVDFVDNDENVDYNDNDDVNERSSDKGFDETN